MVALSAAGAVREFAVTSHCSTRNKKINNLDKLKTWVENKTSVEKNKFTLVHFELEQHNMSFVIFLLKYWPLKYANEQLISFYSSPVSADPSQRI